MLNVIKLFKEEKKELVFIFLFLSMVLVCLPRFDRADYGPIKKFVGSEELYEGLPYDILIYKNYIEFLHTGTGEEKISPPYSYRILVPALASVLPFAPLTSLNIINFIFLSAGLLFLYLTLLRFQLEFEYRITGCLFYICSFPMFYYATSGYIDGTIVGILMSCVYFIVSNKWKIFLAVLFIGTLQTEKMIILFPFLISYFFTNKINLKTSLLISTLFIVIYIAASYLVRSYFPGNGGAYVWVPEMKFIMQNLYRPKTYLSFIISFGIPGVLAVLSYFKFPRENKKYFTYFYVGIATSLLLYLYSIFSAWADGRTVWTMYPFAIPPAVLYLKSYYGKIPQNKK